MNGLGNLEARVMDVLWATTDALSVRDILDRMPDSSYAYTTILTVVTHLHEKEWVARIKHRRAYLYRPVHSRAEATSLMLREIIDASKDPEAVLLHFARTVTDTESQALQRGLTKDDKRRKK